MLQLKSRKKLSFFLSYILLLFQPLQTFGAELKPFDIDIEWNFDGEATSINIYQDDIFLCETDEVSLNIITCEAFIGDQPISFTMTAVTSEGETPPSAPYILTPPEAEVTSGDVSLDNNVDASASDIDGTIISYEWDFNDGDVDNGETTQSDPYILTPPEQDRSGNYIPTADFTAEVTSDDVPLDINFDASASSDIDGTIIYYVWDFDDGDFDDGDFDDGNGEFISHTFLLSGIYTTTLTVIDDSYATSSATITIEVAPPPDDNILPTAVIYAESPGDNTIYHLDAYDSTDEDGLIVAYQWNFGDGETATSNYVEHDYAVPGTYCVTLTVTDDQDGTNETDQIITITDSSPSGEAPVAQITTGLTQHLVQATWEYTDTTNLSGFRLYQNGSQICEKMEPAATQMECLTYLENGPMSFAIKAVDTSGGESLFSETMTYTPSSPPSATEGDAPLTVFFNGGGSSDADGPISSYLWDFGDGTIAETSAAEHTFSIAGDYTISLSVTDTDGNESTTSTVITVLGNLPPVASNSTLNVTEDTPAQGTFSASDVDGDPLTYSISLNGSKGSATLTDNSTGAFTYTPSPDANGTDSISFYANDNGELLSNVGVVTINIAAVNDPPTAENLSLNTSESTSVNGIISAEDPDGDTLTYSVTANGSSGNCTITDTNAGTFTYTPHTGISGNDSFTISASDGNLSATATVSVTISVVNDAPVAVDDTASTPFNTPVTINVLANDSDPDGDTITISAVSTPTNGSATISNSTILYTPTSNFSGEDTFTYTASDNDGATSTGNITVTVSTDPLLTTLVTFNWDYDNEADIAGFRLYMNSTPICETHDPLTRSISCLIPETEGTMEFSLTALDENNVESSMANILKYEPYQETVNTAPAALSDSAVMNENTSATINVLANDTDQDEDTLTIVSVSGPTNGSAVISGDNVTYTPNTDFTGTDSFTYTISDGNENEATGTVTITVNNVNIAPVADNTTITISQDEAYNATLGATDNDGDALSYSIVTNGSLGTAALTDTSSGVFTYTPNSGAYGTDTFTFMVNDGTENSNVATATVTIMQANQPPVAQADAVEIDENTHITIFPLTNDSDPDGDTLTIVSVSGPTNGSAVISGDNVTYTPNTDFTGTDSFTYTISDGNENEATGTVTITVNNVNIAPVADNTTITISQDEAYNATLGATDDDGDALSYSIVTNGSLGTAALTDTSSGVFTYTPNSGAYGTDTFTFMVNDGTENSNVATATVTIMQANQPPVAASSTITTSKNNSLDGILYATDSDGDLLQHIIVTNGTLGTVTITNTSTGAFTYQPNPGKTGTDTFTFKANDSTSDSNIATVTVIITAKAEAEAELSITFAWDYTESTGDLAAFNFYANNLFICQISDTTARQATCQVLADSNPTSFAITAVDINGAESEFSNSLSY